MDPPPLPNPYPPQQPISAAAVAVAVSADQNAVIVPAHTPAPTFNHPPYAEMIYGAIAALKERDGSSRRAIAKYIEQTYPPSQLPPTHSALLTHHLKRLKNSGHLEMVKKSYKIPGPPQPQPQPQPQPRSDAPPPPPPAESASASASAPVGPPRGRGRPPKPKPNPDQQPITQQQQPIIQHQQQHHQPIIQQPIPIPQQSLSVVPVPQPPIPIPQQQPIVPQPNYQQQPQPNYQSFHQQQPIIQTFPEPNVQLNNSQPLQIAIGPAAAADQPTKKRPGRPRKVPAAIGGAGAIVSPKRGRGRPPGSRMPKKKPGPGRPPKPKSVSGVLGPNGVVKRRPGRPSKAEPRSVFIPFASSTNVPIIGAFEQQSNGPSTALVPQPAAPRPRGRPKKDASASAAAASSSGNGTGKKRGRPALAPGVERPKVSRSGRPIGRPKKDATLAITAAPDPNIAVNAELKRKLEYFQTRVGQAVGVLKPYLNTESAADAAAAIQELEGLATLDINAPLIITTQQPVLQS